MFKENTTTKEKSRTMRLLSSMTAKNREKNNVLNEPNGKDKNKITHIIEKKKNTLPPLQTLTHKILKTFTPLFKSKKSKEKKDTAKSTKYYNYQIIPLCDRKSFPLIT